MQLPQAGETVARFGSFYLRAAYDSAQRLRSAYEIYLEDRKLSRNIPMTLTMLPDFMHILNEVINDNHRLLTIEQQRLRSVDKNDETFTPDLQKFYFNMQALPERDRQMVRKKYQEVVDFRREELAQLERGVAHLSTLYPRTSAQDALAYRGVDVFAAPLAVHLFSQEIGSWASPIRHTLAERFHFQPAAKLYGPFHIHPLLQRTSNDDPTVTAYSAILLENPEGTPIEVGVLGNEECFEREFHQRLALCLLSYRSTLDIFKDLFTKPQQRSIYERLQGALAAREREYRIIETAFDQWEARN